MPGNNWPPVGSRSLPVRLNGRSVMTDDWVSWDDIGDTFADNQYSMDDRHQGIDDWYEVGTCMRCGKQPVPLAEDADGYHSCKNCMRRTR